MKKYLFILLFVSLFIFLFLNCDLIPGAYSRDVEYRVTGTANSVSLTYKNEDQGTSQIGNAGLPWSYKFQCEVGDFLYISAQNQGKSGSVTATIYINGRKFKSSTSSGSYVIATASGTAE